MEPFVGEIRMFSFNWAPRGWALCNGAQLNIQQNAALYSLIGVQYGGNGQTTFNLPDLRGQVPMGWGNNGTVYQVGNKGGAETVTLTQAQTPPHTHATNVITTNGNFPILGGNLFAVPGQSGTNPVIPLYAPRGTNAPVALAASTVSGSGGGAHSNMQPWGVTNYCIATLGLYPMRP